MRSGFLSCLAVLAAASGAHAATIQSQEPTIDVQLFYPAPGGLGFFSVESGDVNPHLSVSSGVFFNYARNPLAVKLVGADQSQTDAGAVVANRLDANVFAAFGLFDIFDIGVVFPLVYIDGLDDTLAQEGIDVGTAELAGFTQGDLRIVPKVRLARVADGLLSLALIPSVVIPTASGEAYAGENNLMLAPSLAISSRMGQVFRIAANVGYRYRDRTKIQTLVVDDEVFYKLGVGFDLAFGSGSPFELVAELYGHTPAANGFGMGTKDPLKKEFQKSRTALELDVGLRMLAFGSMMVSLGGGGGLQPGYGAPAPRAFLGLAYLTGEVAPSDEDLDGVVDDLDKCLKRKEDRDGFEDADGCPDLDNDADNVLDEDDQCKMEGEDRDGFEDEDGCPEVDNDKDGFLDADDACPIDAEDKDGFKDDDGCGDVDNDEDSIADTVDKCPSEAEDSDGFQDSDGCPDTDNDGDGLKDLNDLCPNHAEDKDNIADDDGCPEDNDSDGLLDADDKCPNKAEIYNGIDDEDGCPEKLRVKSLVKVTDEKIEIKEKVFFATNSARILGKSHDLLKQVASVLKNYKHIKKVRVEGHTDSRGSKRRNMKLSRERAEAVRAFLIDQGVEPERLEAVGYGPEKPIASNRTRRGREMNRRVEFVIVEQKPIGVDVSEGQEPVIEMQLDMPPGAPPAGEQPVIESPLFEVGPESGAPPPAPETPPPAKGKKKKKKKDKEKEKDDTGGIEFNF